MKLRALAFATLFGTCGAPALAFDYTAVRPSPKPIARFQLGDQHFEMFAIGRNARADTALEREHLLQSRAMGKVYPGYQQPAFVTFDIRLKF